MSANLRTAINTNNVDEVKSTLVNEVIDNKYKWNLQEIQQINNQEINSESVLSLAIDKRNQDIIKLLLLVPGIDLNQPNTSDKKTPLFLAIEKNYEYIVELLLATSKIKINDVIDSITVLILACQIGNLNIVKMLLAYPGIDINFITKTINKTALSEAYRKNHREIVHFLWDTRGINTNIPDKFGLTVFLTAIENVGDNITALTMLNNSSLSHISKHDESLKKTLMSTMLCNSSLGEIKLNAMVLLKIFSFFVKQPNLDYTVPRENLYEDLQNATALSLAVQRNTHLSTIKQRANTLAIVKNILFEVVVDDEDNETLIPKHTKIDPLAIFYAVNNKNADILKILLYDEKSDPRNINFDNMRLEMRDGRRYLYLKNSDGSSNEYYIEYKPTDFTSKDVLTLEDIADAEIKQIIKEFKQNLSIYNAQTKAHTKFMTKF